MSIVKIGSSSYDTDADGVTHINVYSQGKTEVGKWLSNFTKCEIETPSGKFMSLEGYYHYLKVLLTYEDVMVGIPDDLCGIMDELASAFGAHAKSLGSSARRMAEYHGVTLMKVPSDAFDSMFEQAVVAKLITNPEMAEKVLTFNEECIPLVHYYHYGGNKVVYKDHFSWTCDRIYNVLPILYEVM